MSHRSAFETVRRPGAGLRQTGRLLVQPVKAQVPRNANVDHNRTASLRELLARPGLLLVRSFGLSFL